MFGLSKQYWCPPSLQSLRPLATKILWIPTPATFYMGDSPPRCINLLTLLVLLPHMCSLRLLLLLPLVLLSVAPLLLEVPVLLVVVMLLPVVAVQGPSLVLKE
jgi:hypothetical protein